MKRDVPTRLFRVLAETPLWSRGAIIEKRLAQQYRSKGDLRTFTHLVPINVEYQYIHQPYTVVCYAPIDPFYGRGSKQEKKADDYVCINLDSIESPENNEFFVEVFRDPNNSIRIGTPEELGLPVNVLREYAEKAAQ